uniref:Ovule protein n=1 Tax=Haemonchus placei TaxID=6290 RepID=A0A0N4X1L4_HAEPC
LLCERTTVLGSEMQWSELISPNYVYCGSFVQQQFDSFHVTILSRIVKSREPITVGHIHKFWITRGELSYCVHISVSRTLKD